MSFDLYLKPRVEKNLRKIPAKIRLKLILTLDDIKYKPFRGKALRGEFFNYNSVRVWPYRIIYRIERKKKIIIITEISHRQGVYK